MLDDVDISERRRIVAWLRWRAREARALSASALAAAMPGIEAVPDVLEAAAAHIEAGGHWKDEVT